MNTSKEPRLESPYPTTNPQHTILQYHWTQSNETNPRPHRHNQIKNHQSWPTHQPNHNTRHSNQQTRITTKPAFDRDKGATTRPITIAHHEITYRIKQTNPSTTQSPFTTPWEPTVKAKSSKQSQSPQSSSIHDWPIINQWITPPKRQNQGLISKPPPDHNSRIKWNQQTTTSLNNTTKIKPWPHEPRVKQKWTKQITPSTELNRYPNLKHQSTTNTLIKRNASQSPNSPLSTQSLHQSTNF